MHYPCCGFLIFLKTNSWYLIKLLLSVGMKVKLREAEHKANLAEHEANLAEQKVNLAEHNAKRAGTEATFSSYKAKGKYAIMGIFLVGTVYLTSDFIFNVVDFLYDAKLKQFFLRMKIILRGFSPRVITSYLLLLLEKLVLVKLRF